MGRRVSMNPDTYTQGGLMNDMDVRITYARYTTWDYFGKAQEHSPALLVKLLPLDGSAPESEQYLSCGALKDFKPSEDGMWLEAVSDDSSPQGMRNNTNLAHWNNALCGLGLSKARLTGEAALYEGFEVHIIRTKAPQSGQGAGMKEDREILVPSKILKYPWDGKPSGAVATPAAVTAAPAAAAGEPAAAAPASIAAVTEEQKAALKSALLLVFPEVGAVMSRKDAKPKVYSELKLPAGQKKAVTEVIFSADIMDSIGFSVDATNIERMA